MASNSSWLAAYEAQKAAVLQKMTTSKSETDSSAIVSGASEFSGLVDIESVKNFSKSTQVTKLMNTLKKPHPIPVKREVQPVQNPLSSRSTSSSSTASWNVPTNQSASFHPTSSSSSANQSFSTHHQSASSKKNNVHAGFGPNWNNGSASKFLATETFETSKAGQSCGPLISDEKLLSHSATANGVQTNAEVSNRKKKRDNGEVPIKDLFKRVKSDSTKNSADWAKVCKLVMSYVLIT